MVADDTRFFKIPLKGFNVPESCSLQVNDDRGRVMLGGGVAQVVQRLGDMYATGRIRQRGGKRVGDVGIALEQDYVGGLHQLLGSRRFTTAARAPADAHCKGAGK